MALLLYSQYTYGFAIVTVTGAAVFIASLCLAQMDMTKSAGYRAVEELLKAQTTHMTLRKQFEGARVNEITLAQREVRSRFRACRIARMKGREPCNSKLSEANCPNITSMHNGVYIVIYS